VGNKVWEFDERWNGASIPQEHWHFHRQLLARYGIVMRPGDYSDMIDGLRLGKALLVKKMPQNRGIYRWRLKSNARIIFVLSNGRMAFTAWPPTAELRAIGIEML
jgi:hypothetical protein